jgi:hypothetical protein
MQQLFRTQLLSPNASFQGITSLKQQGKGKCIGACLVLQEVLGLSHRCQNRSCFQLGDSQLVGQLLRLQLLLCFLYITIHILYAYVMLMNMQVYNGNKPSCILNTTFLHCTH